MDDLQTIVDDESTHPDVKYHTAALIEMIKTHPGPVIEYVVSIPLPLFKLGHHMPYLLGREKDMVEMWGIPIRDILTSTTFRCLPNGQPAFHEPPNMNTSFILDISALRAAVSAAQPIDAAVPDRTRPGEPRSGVHGAEHEHQSGGTN